MLCLGHTSYLPQNYGVIAAGKVGGGGGGGDFGRLDGGYAGGLAWLGPLHNVLAAQCASYTISSRVIGLILYDSYERSVHGHNLPQ